MKPTNYEKLGCSPTSSSCVQWQGKDIDCITICEGASIDDVIHEIGCMMCTIKDQLDVDTYDLSCFNLPACDVPHTFRELMQFIIGLSCQLRDVYLNGDIGSVSNEDGILTVSIASCFQASLGTSSTITDYIAAIGEKVCAQEITIANQQQAILQLQSQIDILNA